jgi:hypothetical protein
MLTKSFETVAPIVREQSDDNLRAVRGVIFGALLGAFLWLVVAALWWACLRGAP